MDKARSGSNKPARIGAKSVSHASNAGAARIKGGCTPSGHTGGKGAKPNKSGNKGNG